MHDRQMVRADLITGLVLVALGLFVLAESLGMPRFEERRIDPWTVPGLVPGLLGIVLAAMGAVLALRSLFSAALRRPPPHPDPAEAAEIRAGRRRLAICLGLCLIYAVGLVGRVPFWLATGLFVFAFVAAYEWGAAARARVIATAAALAVAAAVLIPLLFERLFLVRLP